MSNPSGEGPPAGGYDSDAPGGSAFGFNRPKVSPREVALFHEGADTDQGEGAKHHTLGRKRGQAAPGDALAALEKTVTENPPDLAVASLANRVRNPDFRINQREYVDGTALASGDFGPDGWASSTDDTELTLPTAPQGGLATIAANGSIRQAIERADVPAGPWTLAWAGSAQGRAYNASTDPGDLPEYADSPVTVEFDGEDDIIIEFRAT